MRWQELFTTLRSGDVLTKKLPNPDAARTSFQRDYDRIIFSSAFRRLQNKTQVFPLPGVVFVHNRLTHSLEVASVGRSLGKMAGDAITDKWLNAQSADTQAGREFNEETIAFYRYELPSVIAAACLAHDIGNPPFGHSGEDAIRSYFKECTGTVRSAFDAGLTEKERQDFLKFEGNANALRTLAHSYHDGEPGGYNLTLTTLAATLKYPSASWEGFDKSTGLLATKKSGYFLSEAPLMEQIADAMSLPKKDGLITAYARHPFVYLTEAADDICYRIIDVEDAFRLRIISLEAALGLFLPFFQEQGTGFESLHYISKKLDGFRDDNQKIQYLRARWIGLMTGLLSKIFLEKEEDLLAGTLEQSLMNSLPEKERKLMADIDDFSRRHIYNYRSVLEIEVAGYEVIGGLLRAFADAALDPWHPKSKKLLLLVPDQFSLEGSTYGKLQSVVDFISGMTDLYAADLYRKITGITMGGLA